MYRSWLSTKTTVSAVISTYDEKSIIIHLLRFRMENQVLLHAFSQNVLLSIQVSWIALQGLLLVQTALDLRKYLLLLYHCFLLQFFYKASMSLMEISHSRNQSYGKPLVSSILLHFLLLPYTSS